MPLQQWSDATNWLTWINNNYFIQEVIQIYKDEKSRFIGFQQRSKQMRRRVNIYYDQR